MAEMASIQWFPGHMTKTRRMIQSSLSLVDGVVEVLDARIPFSSRNPEMDKLVKDKPRMLLLNKSDMADDSSTEKWIDYYKSKGFTVLKTDCKSGNGLKGFLPAVKGNMLKQLIEKRRGKGIEGAPIRLMIVGIPNVGKSSFINRMAKSKKAKVEDRPGVTRNKQWIKFGGNVELLDMPGVLWPKFEDQALPESWRSPAPLRTIYLILKLWQLFCWKIYQLIIRRQFQKDIKLINPAMALSFFQSLAVKEECLFQAAKLILKEPL